MQIEEIQSQIDGEYRQLFENFKPISDNEDKDGPRQLGEISEALFQKLSREEPALSTAMLTFAKEQKSECWLDFQKSVTRLKMTRSRFQEQLSQLESSAFRDVQQAARSSKTLSDYEQIATVLEEDDDDDDGLDSGNKLKRNTVRIVLLTGFEAFN